MDLVKHLLTRHYDPSRYVNQVLDFENEVLTVYLPNLSGQLVGYQQYRPNVKEKRTNHPSEARYFTYTQRGVNACWGLETLDPDKRTVYLVDGIFKASSLHMLGYNALALLTSNPKPMKSWLNSLPNRLIGIGDPDKSGSALANMVNIGFQSEFDLDEYSLEDLDFIIRRFNERGCLR